MIKKGVQMVMSLAMAIILALPGSVFAAGPGTGGTTYYVSNNGSDSNSGTSESAPWKTLDKVNSTVFQPGDQILFESNGIWTGTLSPKGSGTEAAPIQIDAYGTGARPLINGGGKTTGKNGNSPDSAALYLYNQQHWEIRSLELTNWDPNDIETSATARNSNQLANRIRRGVYIYVDENAVGWTGEDNARVLSHIVLENLYIHDVKGDDRFSGDGKGTGGIYVHVAGNKKTKIDDLQILNNRIEDVGRSGISLLSNWQSGPDYSNRFYMTNVVVRGNTIRRTGGDGMIVIGLKDAVLEYNTVSDANYAGPRYQMDNVTYTGAWAVGMFPFFTEGTTIQYNEVYNTRTCDDGQAIDVDGQNNGTLVQYNLTHDNEGGAFLVMVDTYNNSRTLNTTIRYNVSQNDCRSVFSIASVRNVLIYNNTVYVGKDLWTKMVGFSSNGSSVYAKNVEFSNNLFMNFGTRVQDFNGPSAGAVKFVNNWYYGDWEGLMPTEEGIEFRRADPQIVGMDTLPSNWSVTADALIEDLTDRENAVPEYQLTAESPLIDAGVRVKGFAAADRIVPTVYPVTSAENDTICDEIFARRAEIDYGELTDFWGNSALEGNAPDIGAHEYQGNRVYEPLNGALCSLGAEPYLEPEVAANDGDIDVTAVAAGDNGELPYSGVRMLKVSGTGLTDTEEYLTKIRDDLEIESAQNLSYVVSVDGDGEPLLVLYDQDGNPIDLVVTEEDVGDGWTKITADLGESGVSAIALGMTGTADGTIYFDDIRITDLPVDEEAPYADGVSIDGASLAGYPLEGIYTYHDDNGDPEEGTTYQWYVSEDDVTYSKIDGATALSYTPNGSQIGKYIKLGVTPINQFAEGEEVLSDSVEIQGFTGENGFETTDEPAFELKMHTALRTPLDPNYQVIMGIDNRVTDEVKHEGDYSYMVSGLTCLKYVPFTDTIMVNKLFDSNYVITDDTKLSYWMNAKTEAGCYAGVDLILDDGSKLSSSGIMDMAGMSVHPKDAHGGIPMDSWVNVIVDLGALTGKTIREINITVNPVGMTGAPILAYFDDIKIYEADSVEEGEPAAANVAISGTPKVTKTLTGSYTFRSPTGNPEDGTVISWQVGDTEQGPFTTIEGTTGSSTYIPTAADEGKYIRFSVIPKTANKTGAEAGAVVGPIAVIPEDDHPPVATEVKITPNFAGWSVGATLTGSYVYSDVEDDEELGTAYRWLRSDSLNGPFEVIPDATGKVLVVTEEDYGKYFKFEVTPANENKVGVPNLSPVSGQIVGYLLEAEDMTLNGFEVNTLSGQGASQNKVIRVNTGRGAAGTISTATRSFEGVDGTYDLTLWYYDENDGAVDYGLELNESSLANWKADKNFGTGDAILQSRTSYTVSGIDLKAGDEITVVVTEDGKNGEWARTDCIVLTPVGANQGYPVTIAPLVNGAITASQTSAYEGTEIILTVVPNDGYKLKSGSLKVNGGAVAVDNNRFVMPGGEAVVTADFEIVDYYIPVVPDKPNGNTASGWQEIGGKTYYYSNGQKLIGWQKISSAWYYFDADGSMFTGWMYVSSSNTYLYLKPATGIMAESEWVQVDGYRYYFDASGYMKRSWIQLNGNWYYLRNDGVMVAQAWMKGKDGKWYYLKSDGVMATNQWIYGKDKKWYYVGSDGAMLANTRTPDGYYVDANGVWVK